MEVLSSPSVLAEVYLQYRSGVLADEITHNSSIEGIQFARIASRAETYAGDTTIIIEKIQENLKK